MSDRLPELSYFFPAHNEAANVRGLVAPGGALTAYFEIYHLAPGADGSGAAPGADQCRSRIGTMLCACRTAT